MAAKVVSRDLDPTSSRQELQEGRRKGYNVLNPDDYGWLQVLAPHATPFEWLSLDLGAGELTAMALALENPSRIILLDDLLARRTAQAAGLTVWGTLRVVLEAKSEGLIKQMAPLLDDLSAGGLWMSDDIRRRVLALAGE
jgi:predicted nucleic acid-binding protein